jgi:hypothetical protein
MNTWIDAWREATVAIGQHQLITVQSRRGKLTRRRDFVVVGTGVVFGLRGQPSPLCS